MPAAADTHQHLEHHMAYPQHQGKTGPPRPGPHHGPPHHSSHPPPGSYGPQPGHVNHVGYTHHGPMSQHALSGQRGQPGQHGPPQQNGPQINLGQLRSQIGSSAQLGAPGQHGHPGPPGSLGPPGQHGTLSSHGTAGSHAPQGSHGPHAVPNQRGLPGSHIQAGPSAIQHKASVPHGQYGAHVPHSNNIGNQRSHLDGPGSEVRQPPAYPEPPRYPGPQPVHEDMEKHMSQLPTHNGQPAQNMKQYSGAQVPGGGGMNGGGASMSSGDLGRLEEELSQLSRKDLVARTLRTEGEARELQHSVHVQAGELRHLRENQQRLTDDNQVSAHVKTSWLL